MGFCIDKARFVCYNVKATHSGCSAVGEQGTKRLIIVFAEVMSHVASRASRVYRGDAMRHKSGREASVARYPLFESKFNNFFRDVAQLVARVLWEHDVAGSNPVIPTIKGRLSRSDQASFSFQVRFQASMFAFANRILFRLWRMFHSDQKQTLPFW